MFLFAQYNQQAATFYNLFISVRSSTCFGRVFRPSPGAQNCVRYWSDRYGYLVLAWPVVLVREIPDAVRPVFELLMMDGKTV